MELAVSRKSFRRRARGRLSGRLGGLSSPGCTSAWAIRLSCAMRLRRASDSTSRNLRDHRPDALGRAPAIALQPSPGLRQLFRKTTISTPEIGAGGMASWKPRGPSFLVGEEGVGHFHCSSNAVDPRGEVAGWRGASSPSGVVPDLVSGCGEVQSKRRWAEVQDQRPGRYEPTEEDADVLERVRDGLGARRRRGAE